jgi:8-oxo-dGTP diphosphatase
MPRTSHVRIAVAIMHNKKILVGRRGPACTTGKGLLALPGGHVENEKLDDAIRRECLEETGLHVALFNPRYGPYSYTTVIPMAVTDYWPENNLTLWFAATLIPGTPIEPQTLEPDKCEGWRWMSLVELAKVHRTPEQDFWLPYDLFTYGLYPIWRQLYLS